MDQTIRNKLRGVVTQCRKLLEDSTAQALQGRFGIYAARKKGEVQIEDEARMAHLTEEDRACRQDLLDHLEHIQAIGYRPSEALEQLVREIAFTHLNRLCAYKMMETRGLIREAVSRGFKSQGFFFYLSDHPEDEKLHNGGEQETAYRNFLDWLGGTLSQEIGVLFNPNDPANRIYPPQRILDEVLALINDGELKDIWPQDETIGWVYQYFTPKELRDKARKESAAPRNSYELAFRNQFFTPRYVVEFLTDNTLGRIWYEMRKGETVLKDRCRYLVRRPTEIFLKEGEESPAESKDAREDLSQEELLKQLVHIPHRPKKDPREIKVLDPACGSGHFLLYCFDLLQVIYEEVYDDPSLSAALRRDYPAIKDLRRAVPGLILKHNLHGIDIDLRATQIAALALWLRCQRAYQELRLKNGERPKITRSNIVCAEPMPGETDLLKEFTAALQPKVLGQLVEAVFEKMKLAGEAGSLLKIEEEIRDAVMTAKKEYQEELRRQKEWVGYLPGMAPPRERTLFEFSDMTDSEFLDRAEEEIVAALRQYAEKASNGRGFRRRLFAEDAARGFSFVDVCSKKFDVVLMNPPFGEASPRIVSHLESRYPDWSKNLLCAFISRAREILLSHGFLGVIFDRTASIKSSYEKFRRRTLDRFIATCADTGWEVLDANVETTVQTLKAIEFDQPAVFVDIRHIPSGNKANRLLSALRYLSHGEAQQHTYIVEPRIFLRLPNAIVGYYFDELLLRLFSETQNLSESGLQARQGDALVSDWHFRLYWEVAKPSNIGRDRLYSHLYNGADFCMFASPHRDVTMYGLNGDLVKTHPSVVLRNPKYQFLMGIGYGKRGEILDAHILPPEAVFTSEGQAITGVEAETALIGLGFLNSSIAQFTINQYCGQHKHCGYINLLPFCRPPKDICAEVARNVLESVQLKRCWFSVDETTLEFCSPLLTAICDTSVKSLSDYVTTIIKRLDSDNEALQDRIRQNDEFFERAGKVSEHNLARIHEHNLKRPIDFVWPDVESDRSGDDYEVFFVKVIISHLVGFLFGRWDIRFATGERQPPELPDPFDPLPVCPPGMLQGPDGLPVKPEDVPLVYPVRIDWDGILVDDPGHEDDIVRRVRDVLEVIWKERAETIEREACEILGVRELRDYFRKPGNGGFWMDHVKRYSKSRRKAPIYWYLRSAKGNYALWLYYHRLDKDILFKALLNYVEPKIRLEEDRLKTLRGRKEAVGSSGRKAKQIEKDMDRQEQFVSELRDFADKLRRAANLHLEPDLNDGVVLNIAPLWELTPWKEAKEYWEDLVEGKYEWSSIGKQLRAKGIVKL